MTEKIIIEDNKNTIHRLQAECTEKTDTILKITEYYNAVVEQNKSLQAELKQKEQECEGLKKELKDSEQRALNRYINNNLQCVLPSKCIYVNRYKQALEDIEKIAKFYMNDLDRRMSYLDLVKISDIISKAKEECK